MTTTDLTLIADARASAANAAEHAGVTVRLLTSVADFTAVTELFKGIWRGERTPVNVETLRAVSKAGSYVGGAFDADGLVGACFGFYGAPHERSMHSHIAGVSQGVRGRNVGFAIKVHQRAWALQNNVDEIAWTFDPLISRNAYFNLVKLGGRPAEYLENFYGPMDDEINGSDDTDRMLVAWDVREPRVAAAARGEHPHADASALPALLRVTATGAPERGTSDAPVVAIGIPRDIEALRRQDPATATSWRIALRETLGAELKAGAHISGFDRSGAYIVTRGTPQ